MRRFVPVFVLGCGASTVCGEGTHEVDGTCEAHVGPSCGPGTVLEGGECVAEPSTVLEDTAVVDEGTPECGDGTVLRGEECVALDLQYIRLPFPDGAEVTVSQGHNGWFSHTDADIWAVDFPVPQGTTIVAVRAGTVLDVKEDSDASCPDPSCGDLGNYVAIDHGDGTIGRYLHLQLDGALVAYGEVVGRGQPIGLSGQTGWTTAPHLHLQVDDLLHQSLPLRFEEVEENGGMVYAGETFVSGNVEEPAPALTWSSCPADLYRPFGVTLTSATPCTVAQTDVPYPLAGTTTGPKMIVAVWSDPNAVWLARCVTADEEGKFETEFVFASLVLGEATNLVMQAADEGCAAYQGFSESPELLLEQ